MFEIFKRQAQPESSPPSMPGNLDELIAHTRRLGKNYRRTRELRIGDITHVWPVTEERRMVARQLKWLRSDDARKWDFQDVLRSHLDWEFGLQIFRIS